jgi:unsaturated rhamnogalacturonyl hydrolase
MKILLWTLLLAIPLACSSSSNPSPRDAGPGDLVAAGTAGKLVNGGSTATGGTATSTGEITAGSRGTATAGVSGTGGAATTLGSTGTSGTGGSPATGGGKSTGGTPASGGAPATGGADSGTTNDAGIRHDADATADFAPETSPNEVADAPLSLDTSAPGARDSNGNAGLPSQSSVLTAMRKANDFFLGRWPDPTVDIVTDKTRPSNLWTRAVYFEGLMALYAVEPDAAKKANLYDYAVRWGASSSHPWTLTYTAASTMTSNADNQACGQTYIDLYQIDPKPERIATIKANIDDMVLNGTTNVWTWIDAIQMSMPVFARLGAIYSDPRYFDTMWALYNNTRTQQGGGLRNPADGLWWRDLHFTPGGGTQQRMTSTLNGSIPGSSTDAYIVAPNGKELYWSRGNGWVMAALVRVLDWLPTSDSHRATYLADFQSMAASLLPLQRTDGFWNESLLDPSHCSTIGQAGQDGPETSGTALFIYGLAWGIRQGLLDSATYAASLSSAWQGMTSIALQGDGRLGYVQSTGDRPCTDTGALGPTKLANFDDYGVGAFLLAASEVYRLAN